MKPKMLVLLICILAIAMIAITYKSERPEAKVVMEEIEILKYEPIDFEKLLAKPEVTFVLNERDPFKSSLEDLEVLAMAGDVLAPGLGTESLKLTGIIRGPDGPVALIKLLLEDKTHMVKPDSTIGKYYIERITDNEVILTVNGTKAVLKLGGGKNEYE